MSADNRPNVLEVPGAPKKPIFYKSRLTRAERESMEPARAPQSAVPLRRQYTNIGNIVLPESGDTNEEVWRVPNNVFASPGIGNTPRSKNLSWANKPKLAPKLALTPKRKGGIRKTRKGYKNLRRK
jgi:hypothetical protein